MLRANHIAEGACYTTLQWRRMTALNVLAAAGRLFGQASLIRHLDRLATTFELTTDRGDMTFNRLLWKLDPPVVDAVRITCCFENLFKTRLLLSGCVVHEIDRNVAPDLRKEQERRPVLIRTVKRLEGVVGRRDKNYSFKVLRPTTLSWKVLTGARAYRERIALPDRLFESLAAIAESLNSLHFLAPHVVRYNGDVFDDLRYVRTCFNVYVVRKHNRLLKSLGLAGGHRLEEVRLANALHPTPVDAIQSRRG